jgi:CheY-like chemotaxis protein
MTLTGKQTATESVRMQPLGQTIDSKVLAALFPPARRSIFCILFLDCDRWWTLDELAGRTGIRQATLDQQVMCLRNGGIVRSKMVAGHTLVQPDPGSQVFSELHSIVTKLAPPAASGTEAETILVVEDQAATARIACILLESWGYQVFEANGGAEALKIFENHAKAIRLLLTDVIMPRMSGPELAEVLRDRKPGLPVVFMSGSAGEEVQKPGVTFLAKPFTPATLARIIRDELDQAAGPVRNRTV